MLKRLIASIICFTFSLSNLQFASAQDFNVNQLPVPGTMIGESVPFAPLALKGVIVNPQRPLEFQFIVDTGKGPQDPASIKEEANQLIKYFLAGLTIPEGDLWVNLSPYEKNRMVPEALGQTDLGRDLLAQDYILKQLTASLIYPEKDLGKEFWSRVYAKAQKQFGTTNVPVNTFNKVWILPDQAQVYENVNAAYVTKATLKVMLDEDYLSLQKHHFSQSMSSPNASVGDPEKAHSLASSIVRQIILPEIEKEVNTGKNFAPLRQIYQALILAKWYKETIQNGLLDAVYTNKNKVAGVNVNDPAVKEEIYNRYLQAYKKGAFNFIKDDPTPDGQVVPRKYFSGGSSFAMISLDKIHGNSAILTDVLKKLAVGALLLVLVGCGKSDEGKNQSAQNQKSGTQIIKDIKGYNKEELKDRGISVKVIAPSSRFFIKNISKPNKSMSPLKQISNSNSAEGKLEDAAMNAAFFKAIRIGDKDGVEQLLANGVDVNEREHFGGETALMIACRNGHEDIVKLLLAVKGIEVDEAFRWAVEKEHRNIVEMLLSSGIDIGLRNKDILNILEWACRKGYKKIVELLLDRGVDVNARSLFHPRTALMTASQNGNLDIVELLIARKADVNLVDNHGLTALFFARNHSLKNSQAIVDMLLAAGAREDVTKTYLNTKDINSGRTPFFGAVYNKNRNDIIWMIEQGADVNTTDNNGNTPLIETVRTWYGSKDVVEILLTHGANVNAINKDGATALSIARARILDFRDQEAIKKYQEIVEILIAAGAKDDAMQSAKLTKDSVRAKELEFIAAVRLGEMKKAEQLLVDGVNVDARWDTQDGDTTLMIACVRGDKELVKFVLARRANVNAKDLHGKTALMLAALQGYKVIVEQLLTNGADVNAKDNYGQTALSLARQLGQQEIIKILIAHDAKDDVISPTTNQPHNQTAAMIVDPEKLTEPAKHKVSDTEVIYRFKEGYVLTIEYDDFSLRDSYTAHDPKPDWKTSAKLEVPGGVMAYAITLGKDSKSEYFNYPWREVINRINTFFSKESIKSRPNAAMIELDPQVAAEVIEAYAQEHKGPRDGEAFVDHTRNGAYLRIIPSTGRVWLLTEEEYDNYPLNYGDGIPFKYKDGISVESDDAMLNQSLNKAHQKDAAMINKDTSLSSSNIPREIIEEYEKQYGIVYVVGNKIYIDPVEWGGDATGFERTLVYDHDAKNAAMLIPFTKAWFENRESVKHQREIASQYAKQIVHELVDEAAKLARTPELKYRMGLEAIKAMDPYSKLTGIQLLANSKKITAIAPIKTLLTDNDPEVRKAAQIALKSFGINFAMLQTPQFRKDNAVLVNPAQNGGIDLNEINVLRNGKKVNVLFDPAQLNALEQGGFAGFSFKIESMTRISSPFQLLGINSPAKQMILAKA